MFGRLLILALEMQFQRLKQQQMMKQGGYRQFPVNQNQQVAENRARNGVNGSLMNLPNSSWPTLQQSQSQQQQPNTGSGMRAVFLGNPGPKRECAGTGVFLPRRIGTQTETRKKPGNIFFPCYSLILRFNFRCIVKCILIYPR